MWHNICTSWLLACILLGSPLRQDTFVCIVPLLRQHLGLQVQNDNY